MMWDIALHELLMVYALFAGIWAGACRGLLSPPGKFFNAPEKVRK